MKKLAMSLLLLVTAQPAIYCGHGDGAAVAAGLGGLMVGSMLGSAASDSKRHSRVEEKVDRVQREKDQEKVSQLQREIDKKDIESKLEQQRLMDQQRLLNLQQERDRSNTMLYILLGVIILLFLIVIGLGVFVVNARRKHD